MRLPREVDFLVIGAGIAGLRAAEQLATGGDVLVVTKQQLAESNTQYAQGGIAVAMGGGEDVDLHWKDTLAAGDGLVDERAARALVEEGPARVSELVDWGTEFDQEHGELLRTREGAHSLPRILHAHGDATGREIGRALLRRVRANPRVQVVPWVELHELLLQDGRVCGAMLLADGELQAVRARAVLLASGGAGSVYSDSTNPPGATGDGIAAAWRAGADIEDMEFFQFHPTALSLPGVRRFLLSEALRGEGAVLRNASGERFMPRYHAMEELAPRDVVARAITREGIGPRGEALPVYLDMRHVEGDLDARFPVISAFLRERGLSLREDLIPVRPAAHYLMGGVRTDLHGRTSLHGLYAAGEVACTGAHGANRLASNSLLEGLVFGERAARAMIQEAAATGDCVAPENLQVFVAADEEELRAMQAEMWLDAGLLRDRAGLERALAWLEAHASLRQTTARNLYDVARLIVRAGLAREESRGAHFRLDFPQRNDAKFQRHSSICGDSVSFT